VKTTESHFGVVVSRMGRWFMLSLAFLLVAVILRVTGATLAASIPALIGLVFLGAGYGWESGRLKRERASQEPRRR
jgi:hypothetical protein